MALPTLVYNGRAQRVDHSNSNLDAIRQEFAEDNRLHALTIEISDGYVYLSGSVDLLEDARQAVKKVQEKHVAGVINKIKVRTPSIPDSALRLQVETKLKDLEVDSVRVRVRRGIVNIQGTITTEKERKDILSATCSTPGVRGVDDSMQLRERLEKHTPESFH